MTSSEDVQSRSINPFIMNSPPIIKYIEPRERSSSISVVIDSDTELPVSPMSPFSKSDEAMDEYNDYRISTARPLLVKFMSMRTIGQQFRVRKVLRNRL